MRAEDPLWKVLFFPELAEAAPLGRECFSVALIYPHLITLFNCHQFAVGVDCVLGRMSERDVTSLSWSLFTCVFFVISQLQPTNR